MLRESKIAQNPHQLGAEQVVIFLETLAQQFGVEVRLGGQGPCQQPGFLPTPGSTKETPHLTEEEDINVSS